MEIAMKSSPPATRPMVMIDAMSLSNIIDIYSMPCQEYAPRESALLASDAIIVLSQP